ncbi:hypothetical protein THAOC_16025, partial [Thalassiosira oceanica]
MLTQPFVSCRSTGRSPQLFPGKKSLESEEYGFTWLEPSQDLYIRHNVGDSVGDTYNLTMHCKYFAASATLPPVPEGNLQGGGAQLQLGLCMYGNDVHSAAATIEGNAFTPVASYDINGHELFFSENQHWDLHGFEGTPCSDGGILLQAPTLLGAGAVAFVTANPDIAGQILHYPLQDCAGSSAEDSFCYDMTHHLTADSGSSQPFLTDHYTRLGVDFDSCSVLCERLADYVLNIDNPYRGVDVDMNSNRCYCLFDARPTCPQFPLASCFPWEGADDGSGPVSHSMGEPGTYPFPVIGTSSDLERLWDGTVSADSGVCVFIAGHQRDQWGPDLESLGWIDEGDPDGFGYPNQLALYCQYNVASARLPPFHDFTIEDSDASWGIHHGLCTFGNMHGVPFVSNIGGLVNVALHGNARQSTTYHSNYVASKAVDGDMGGFTHTQMPSSDGPWWEVDLEFPSVIRTISVYNRADCCQERLIGALISLHRVNSQGNFEELVEQEFGTSEAVMTVDFTEEIYAATRVRIRLPGTGILSLGEVEVMGYVIGIRFTHTQYPSSDGPWWEVDLEFPSVIRTINVYNRASCCQERLIGALISLHRGDEELVEKEFGTSEAVMTVDFTEEVYMANRVRIRLPGSGILSLGEVEVMGYVPADLEDMNYAMDLMTDHELTYEPIEIPFIDTTSTSQNGNDSTICVMTVDYRNYPELASGVASWRQSLEADGFTRLEDIGEEELCLWPNWEEQDVYCHYRLTMHCKYNAVSATLPPAPEAEGNDRTLSLAACVYGSDVNTAAATVGGNSYNPIPSSQVDEHQIFWSTNRYWDLVGYENTPCNDGGIFLQGPQLGAGEVVSITLNHLQALGVSPPRYFFPLSMCQGDCDTDSQCEGFLKCFQRADPSDAGPPGCPGSTYSEFDYCYMPSIIDPIQMWEDSAAYQISGFESTPCNGGVFHRASRTNAPADTETIVGQVLCVFYAENQLESWGTALSTAGWIHEGTREGFMYSEVVQLQVIEGARLNPLDCEGDLRCFSWESDEPVPGCVGSGSIGVDYCYGAEPLVLFCKHGEASAGLPPFPDSQGGMAHGICSLFPNSQAVPLNTSPDMTYEEVQITSSPLRAWGGFQLICLWLPKYTVQQWRFQWNFLSPVNVKRSSGGVTTIGNVRDRESLSVPSPYTVGGFEHTPCNGGVFLRRSSDMVSRGTEIEVSLSTAGVCVFVESAYWRSGGFLTSLEQLGFTPYVAAGFTWSISTPPSLFCTGADHVTLPATTTSQFVHGICTFGNTPDPIASNSVPVNLALYYGTATQSTTRTDNDGVASRAIDGNTNGDWSGNSVTHTEEPATAEPSWEVELQFPSAIRTIIVYNRADCCQERLTGALVSLHRGNEKLVEKEFGTSEAVMTVDFTDEEEVYVATRVRIRLPSTGILSLAEVEVIGYVPYPHSELVYTRVPIAATDQTTIQMWGDQTYTVSGFEHTPCRYGNFYRPSRFKNIREGTIITIPVPTPRPTRLPTSQPTPIPTRQPVPPSGICIFVESHSERDGGFSHSLVEHEGFTHFEIDGFTWQEQYLPSMYCIDSDHMTLPETTTAQTVHGICTIGYPVAYASAVTTEGPLVYFPVDLTTTSLFTGFENTPCYGDGTFLWPLPGHDLINLALHGNARQSTTYSSTNYAASKAVDGDMMSGFTHTEEPSSDGPWWEVDLEFPSVIRTISVYNRANCCQERLIGALISLHRGNEELVEKEFGTSEAVMTVDFTEEVYVATRVRIRLPGTGVLSLGEVQVMGYVNIGLPQGSIISVSLLTESPALSTATSGCNAERCIYRCISSYGPILSSEDLSYHCAKGCAQVPSDGGPFELADLNKFCDVGEIQRHSTCLDTCDTVASEEGQNACRYGCQSWMVRA